ncbi:hypothetical protein IEO70_03755 [Bacillus sp. AGMB 02131]|uniref:Uncharacterized protein n=1 Tax=Peribacillus faecalis TaxID=2772559 RepID=A0A927CWY2_9BACI|nr:hypothetical protein [Peribacillus faecalis]MBD3107470.1 hypothetical protein [Peribacillus faecalis]
MSYTLMVWNYIFLAFSFICVFAATRKSSKITRNWVLVIYIATVSLYTYLVIGEIITPSLDANIGLGGAILLMRLVSSVGIIFAVIYLLSTIRKSR